MQDIEELQRIQTRSSEGLTKEERKEIEIEESLETLSKYLDGLFKVPGVGWKFGLDSLIGLIPNVGDISTSIVSSVGTVRLSFRNGLDLIATSTAGPPSPPPSNSGADRRIISRVGFAENLVSTTLAGRETEFLNST